MREYKFRAWDKKKRKMLYLSPNDTILFKNGKCMVWKENQYDETEECCCCETFSDVIPMQYTELKDKNGKEIYALDKIKAGSFEYIVKWNDKAAAWFCEPVQQEHKITTTKPLFAVLEEWGGVVIGTIWDKPELLKEVE